MRHWPHLQRCAQSRVSYTRCLSAVIVIAFAVQAEDRLHRLPQPLTLALLHLSLHSAIVGRNVHRSLTSCPSTTLPILIDHPRTRLPLHPLPLLLARTRRRRNRGHLCRLLLLFSACRFLRGGLLLLSSRLLPPIPSLLLQRWRGDWAVGARRGPVAQDDAAVEARRRRSGVSLAVVGRERASRCWCWMRRRGDTGRRGRKRDRVGGCSRWRGSLALSAVTATQMGGT